MNLKHRTSLSLAKWLALLAIGVQLVLPLSVGLQIAARGTASALTAFNTELCLADHSVASPDADANDRSGPGNTHNDNPAGGCPLCLALQAMHAFTDASIAPLPAPRISGKSLAVAAHDAPTPVTDVASYQSRAPPVMA